MKKRDRSLGMHRDITRRDFIQKTGIVALGTAVAANARAGSGIGAAREIYPPTRTGLRGSHPGSFEAAHALRTAPGLPRLTTLRIPMT